MPTIRTSALALVGAVTLASGRPVPRKALIAAFEASLQAIGAALVKDQESYRIIPLGDAIGQGGFVRGDTGRLDELAGELQHIRTEIHGDSLPCGVHSDSRHAGR